MPPRYYIAIEQELVIECGSMMAALYNLLAVHWIFNILHFPSSRKKKGAQWAAYNSTTAAIACHLNSN